MARAKPNCTARIYGLANAAHVEYSDRLLAMLRPLKTLHEYFALFTSLTLLGIICLTWSVFAMPLCFILPRKLGAGLGRRGIMAAFRLYAWSLSAMGAYRLDMTSVDSLRGGPPVILAPNHPCLIDALLILGRHPNVVCVMKAACCCFFRKARAPPARPSIRSPAASPSSRDLPTCRFKPS